MKAAVKKIVPIIFSIILVLSACVKDNRAKTSSKVDSNSNRSTPDQKDTEPEKTETVDLGKVLVVYFTLTGSTRDVADKLQKMTDGEIIEIKPDFNYLREDIEDVAKDQISKGFQPKLLNEGIDLESYDVIFVGSPVWWFTVTPPVMSFLSEYDLTDKNIVPFCTYKTDYGTFFDDFEAASPNANIMEGRNFSAEDLKDTSAVEDTLKLLLEDISEAITK